MGYTVRQISQALGASFEGDADIVVSGASEPAYCGSEDIALAMTYDYAEKLKDGSARVAILWEGADWQTPQVRRPAIGIKIHLGGVSQWIRTD